VGALTIRSAGQAVMQAPTGGPSNLVYSDAGLTTPVTLPQIVDCSATYYLTNGVYTITVTDTVGTVQAVQSVVISAATPVTVTTPATQLAAPAPALYSGVTQRLPGAKRGPVTMVWGGQAGHPYTALGSAGTFTLSDTADAALGTVAAKVTTTGSGAQSVIGQFAGTAMNMTGLIPIIWLKVENLAHMLSLHVWLGANGLTNAYTWNLKENPATYPWISESTWVAITLPLGGATITGTPPRGALTDVEVQVYDDSAGQVTLHFGGLGFVPQSTTWPSGVVSFTFDDGLATQVATARPYLDKYGYRATAYVIAETLWNPASYYPAYFTIDQAHSLETLSGWEIAAHAYTAYNHNTGYALLPPAAAVNDMAQAKAWLLTQGFAAPWHMSYPLGQWTNTLRTQAQALFASARTLANLSEESLPPADPQKLRVFTIANSTTLGAMTAAVDRAAATAEWLIFVMHSVVPATSISTDIATATFQSLVDYVAAKPMPVRLVSEVLGTTP
jgi:peptidoglycan/xylan/chitin deacetylase (PgdA/CDA1 family)